MGEFIDFIFSNLFLIVIIISGIIGFMGNNNKEEQKKNQEKNSRRTSRPVQRQQPRTQPAQSEKSSETAVPSQRLDKVPTEELDLPTETPINIGSIQDEQREQMERLEHKYGGKDISDINLDGIHPSLMEGMVERKKEDYAEEKRELKSDLKRSLKNKGLMNGIIMAEVLGKPRATNPYRTVIREREGN